jgi:hypothetical protein
MFRSSSVTLYTINPNSESLLHGQIQLLSIGYGTNPSSYSLTKEGFF